MALNSGNSRNFVALSLAIVATSAVADGYYNANDTQRLISNSTVFAETARDHEPWRAFFSESGDVRYVYQNGSSSDGTWTIGYDGLMITLRSPPQCKRIFKDENNALHWKNCSDDATTSYITKIEQGNALDRPSPGLLGEKGNEAILGIVGGLIGGIQRQVPSDNPVASLTQGVSAGLIDPQIERLLNGKDRQLAFDAVVRGLRTGRRQDWRDEDSGASGSYEVLGVYTGPSGRQCQKYKTPVHLADGRSYIGLRAACLNEDGDWELVAT